MNATYTKYNIFLIILASAVVTIGVVVSRTNILDTIVTPSTNNQPTVLSANQKLRYVAGFFLFAA